MKCNVKMMIPGTAVLLAAMLLSAGTASAKSSLPDFTSLVEDNAKAVVNISTTRKREGSGAGNPHALPNIPEDNPFYEFFRKYFGEIPEGDEPFQERSSLGSGFIIAREGYIITNFHVIEAADEIVVRLSDRTEYDAEIIGTDERSDIALLKITGEDLPVLKLGDSSRLKVGEWVLAIGSPFGLDYSVTKGIVSAIGRPLPNESYVPFIQTDVPINPGNSGGPLFNMDGEVVGVNSQIYSRTGGFMGLSFAVPINLVNNVYEQLREQGHVSRGWLGVLIQDVNRELAESFNMKKPHGALVSRVLADSPAEAGGLDVGDIIVRYNGVDVSYSSDLPPLVGNTMIGTTVKVEILRGGRNQAMNITISELPEDEQIALRSSSGTQGGGGGTDNALRLQVRDLDDEQRRELEIGDHGVLVENVLEGPASSAGIRNGDIILQLNNIKVKNVVHFLELAGQLSASKPIPVLVQRRGSPLFLALKLGDSGDG